MSMPPLTEAKAAESAVSTFLSQEGWRICARNFRGPGFEIDILAADNQKTLLIGEVKFRKRFDPKTARLEDFVSAKQLGRIKGGALRFISQVGMDVDYLRLDVFVVTGMEMKQLYRYSHIKS